MEPGERGARLRGMLALAFPRSLPSGALRRAGLLAALASLTALASGCGDDSSDPTAPASSGLDGTTYVVTGVTEDGQERRLVPGTEIRLAFAEGRLGITAGCNSMRGGYTLDGTRLTVGPMATTEMGCPGPRMRQDTWIAGLFADPVQLTLGENPAVISGGTVLDLADRRQVSPDLALEGTAWVLDTLIDGEAASSVPGNRIAYLQIEEGTAQTYDGCNWGGSPVRVDGAALHFGSREQTSRGCLGGAARELQDAYAAVLDGQVEYTIEEDRLTLEKGDQGLGFHAVDKLPRPR